MGKKKKGRKNVGKKESGEERKIGYGVKNKNTAYDKTYEPEVTIIIPTHSAPVNTINTIVKSIQKQEYTGEITVLVLDNGKKNQTKEMPPGVMYIKNEENIGLAGSLNKGIHLARTGVIITLHQDCVPTTEDWLRKLVDPLKEKKNVLSSSQQVLPREVWQTFSFWHKVFAVPELKKQKVIHERATAYKRGVVLQCGSFDTETYRTAGEDTDLFIKMKQKGRLCVSDAIVKHMHAPHNDSLWKFIKTFLRCHEAIGVLNRKYPWEQGFQFVYDVGKSILAIGMIIAAVYVPFIAGILFVISVILANITHLNTIKYIRDIRLIFLPVVYTFVWYATLAVTWKGFLIGKQTIE